MAVVNVCAANAAASTSFLDKYGGGSVSPAMVTLSKHFTLRQPELFVHLLQIVNSHGVVHGGKSAILHRLQRR